MIALIFILLFRLIIPGLITYFLYLLFRRFLPSTPAIVLAALISGALQVYWIGFSYPGYLVCAIIVQLVCAGALLVLEGRRRARAEEEAMPDLLLAFGDNLRGPPVEVRPPGPSSVGQPGPQMPPPLPTTKPRRGWNIISNHWRGLYELGAAYWVFGFTITLVITLANLVVSLLFLVDDTYEPASRFFTVIGILLGTTLLAVWQLVGIWRSAERRTQQRRARGKRAFWATVTKVCVALGIANVVITFTTIGLVPAATLYRVAFMGDPDVPGYSVRTFNNGTEALIRGGFKYGLTADFEKLLAQSPNLRTLHMVSDGGRVGEANRLQQVILKAGLRTNAPGMCASACAFAFLGGTERTLGPRGTLGFHAASLPGTSDAIVKFLGQLKPIQMLLQGNVAQEFSQRVLKTPGAELWRPTPDELYAANVITSLPARRTWALPPGRAADESLSPEDSLAAGSPILTALRGTDPEAFQSFATALLDRRARGESEASIQLAIRDFSHAAVHDRLANASDAALLGMMRLLGEELNYMELHDDMRTCSSFAAGNWRDPATQQKLTQYMARFQARGAEVITTAAEARANGTQSSAPVELSSSTKRRLSGRTQPPAPGSSDLHFDVHCGSEASFIRMLAATRTAEAAAAFRQVLAR